MFYVMSAEEVDGHIEPFLHAICEDDLEASEEVAKVVEKLDLRDQDDNPLKPGVNDMDDWAIARYDADGLTAWNCFEERKITVVAKFVKTTKTDIIFGKED